MAKATQMETTRPALLLQIKPLIRTMRPSQWTKNVFVWAAVLFDQKLFYGGTPFNRYMLNTLITFVVFCLISSAVYIINDLSDIERDRQHPTKCRRPLASGALSPAVAVAASVLIVLITVPLSLWVDVRLAPVVYGYLLMMVAYSWRLKHIVIVDVLTLAAGFVLRVGAGVVAAEADRFSPWIYVCMSLLALFLALGKRRQEIVLMKENSGQTRSILEDYNLRFLDEMLSLVSSSAVMAYSLYTFSAPNLPANHTMMLTVPFVLYGIFRYLYLIHVKGEIDPPDQVVLKDRPLQIDLALFGLFVVLVFYVLR